jgi:hypothetical protein
VLEMPAQQREILLAQHVELLIWHGHKARQGKLSRRHVSISPRTRHESQTMGISRALDLCTHPTVHLGRLELGEQLIHHEGLILLQL